MSQNKQKEKIYYSKKMLKDWIKSGHIEAIDLLLQNNPLKKHLRLVIKRLPQRRERAIEILLKKLAKETKNREKDFKLIKKNTLNAEILCQANAFLASDIYCLPKLIAIQN